MKQEMGTMKRDIRTMKLDIGMLKTHVVRIDRVAKNLAIRAVGVDARLRRVEDAVERGFKKLDMLDVINERLIAFASDVEAARKDRGPYDLSYKEHRDALLNHEARIVRLEKKGGPAH